MIAIIVAAVLVFGAGIGVYAYFNRPEKPISIVPRIGEKPEVVQKFIMSSKFDELTPMRKHIELEAFADRKKEFEQLHANHQITDEQYRDILPYAWIGKKFKQIANYNQMSDREKRDYIQHLLDKDIGEPNPKDDKGKEIKRDKKKTEEILSRLSNEDRTEVAKFERILDDAEKERRRRDKEIERANKAAAASRPASRPADTTKPPVKPADATKPK
jgi:hypothetical protein